MQRCEPQSTPPVGSGCVAGQVHRGAQTSFSSSSRLPASSSPASSARNLDSGLRPAEAHSTRPPFSTKFLPTDEPLRRGTAGQSAITRRSLSFAFRQMWARAHIMPGCSSPIVVPLAASVNFWTTGLAAVVPADEPLLAHAMLPTKSAAAPPSAPASAVTVGSIGVRAGGAGGAGTQRVITSHRGSAPRSHSCSHAGCPRRTPDCRRVPRARRGTMP